MIFRLVKAALNTFGGPWDRDGVQTSLSRLSKKKNGNFDMVESVDLIEIQL